MIKPIPKNQQKSPYFKDNFIFPYLIVDANFSEARVRRNPPPTPPHPHPHPRLRAGFIFREADILKKHASKTLAQLV